MKQHDARSLPRISVVMAVFNGERYLREAIDSILGQTFADFEFIIVDDGSTDRTAEILRTYRDPRIHLFENGHNIGLTRSLNRGLHLARGEFIARQDADDVSEPRRFEKQLRYLQDHPEIVLLGAQCTIIDGQGRRLGRFDLPQRWIDLRWALLFSTPLVHSAVMLRRRAVLNSVGGYDEDQEFAQDYELWWRLARRWPAANLPNRLVRYRVHADARSRNRAAAAQFRRMRTARLARLLGWEPDDERRNEARRGAITALALGWSTDLEQAAIDEAIDDLLRLQRAFSHEAGLDAVERRRHGARLRSRVARNLVAIAATRHRQHPTDRWALMRRAGAIHWPALLRPWTFARCVGLAGRLANDGFRAALGARFRTRSND